MSEEKEIIINGIDVSEKIRYCNNCSNLGLDFKTGKFYCGLSNRKDELPEILSCENFSSNCYIKRLQQENEDLKTYIQKMDKPEIKTIDGEIALKNIELQQENKKIKKQYNCYACGNCNGKEDYINLEKHHKGLRKQFDELAKRNNTLSLRIEEVEKENEELYRHCQICENFIDGIPCKPLRDMDYDLQKVINQRDKYIKTLEEIRKEANRLLYEENPIYGYNNSNYFEILAKYVLAKTEEVLNGRD